MKGQTDMEQVALEKLKVYYHTPRFGVICSSEKLISVDLEGYHLQLEPQNGMVAKWIDTGRITEPHLPGRPYFDRIWKRYLETMERLNDETKISAAYNPHGMEEWLYRYGRYWIKLDARSFFRAMGVPLKR